MKTSEPKHQPRWRVSEHMAAELAHARRESGLRSWDQFHRALLEKWNQKPGAETPETSEESSHIRLQLKELKNRSIALHDLLESQEESLQIVCEKQTQIVEALRRLIELLEIAMAIGDSDSLALSASSEAASSPSHNSPIDKIRKRAV